MQAVSTAVVYVKLIGSGGHFWPRLANITKQVTTKRITISEIDNDGQNPWHQITANTYTVLLKSVTLANLLRAWSYIASCDFAESA